MNPYRSPQIFQVVFLILGISLQVSAILKSNFSKYNKTGLSNGFSGQEIGGKMPLENGIYEG